MEEINKILAVSWITQYCHVTVQAAISLAEKYDAELSVIHVVDTQLLQGWNFPFKVHEEEDHKELERIKSEINSVINREKKEGVKIKTIVKEGDPIKEILNVVEKEKIDLVVLRAHEESRIEQFMVGSSNNEIIRKMPCSIFLVKGKTKIKTAQNNKK